jgi:catechol 2,3-dioxygenase-like lactoylglutathione lyase family enzyme
MGDAFGRRLTMIEAVHTATVFVRDQAKALDFYVNKLGFETRRDEPMGPDSRWIEVAPPGSRTAVLLYKPTPEMPGASSFEAAEASIGKWQTILFACPDVRVTHAELSGRGVNFPQPPEQQFWGWWAVFEDQDGNSFGLSEVVAGA